MIINIGSAITCVANSALGAYGATKAGLAYWNDALRRELATRGVRVCLVEPGPFKTEFMDALVDPGARGRADAPDPRQRRSLDECECGYGGPPHREVARAPASAGVGPEAVRLAVPDRGIPRAALPATGRPAGDRDATARSACKAPHSKRETATH